MRTEYLTIRLTAKQMEAAYRALYLLHDCHDKFADCSPKNHTDWEAVALFHLRSRMAAALAPEIQSD